MAGAVQVYRFAARIIFITADSEAARNPPQVLCEKR